MSEDQIKIRVICPKCSKSEYIMVPKENIASSGKGLTTILIPEDVSCEHTYQIFVDKNGAVRGYETPDFELKFETIEEETEQIELTDKGAIEVLLSILGEELFLKSLRSVINNNAVFCISEQKYIKDFFQSAFKRIMEEYTPEIEVITMNDYNQTYRSVVYSSNNKNCFVFNSDLQAIIKEPFKKAFRKEKYELERSIVALIKSLNVEDIVSVMTKQMKELFERIESIKDEIVSKKIENKKDLDKRIQKTFGKKYKLDITTERIEELITNRYDVDPEKVFMKVDEKLDKLKSLF